MILCNTQHTIFEKIWLGNWRLAIGDFAILISFLFSFDDAGNSDVTILQGHK